MEQDNFHILDMPNEILFFVLKKLDNIDVLYSFLGINNQRLDIIAQEQIFSDTLNFAPTSSYTNEISSISSSVLDRFCNDILPRIHQNVNALIVESLSMEYILSAGTYPNLTKLKLCNFNQEIILCYFTNDCPFRYIYGQQITDLTLISNENYMEITLEEYTKKISEIIFAFFAHLKHLTIMPSSLNNCSRLSFFKLPSMTFSFPTLTTLCVNVDDFNDCLALLDGRLQQLNTLIIEIDSIYYQTSESYKMDSLPNLKCFSLICYNPSRGYHSLILPLLRRMSHLEELTLYIHILNELRFISGTHLDTKILTNLPRLHTFTFYFACENDIVNRSIRILNSDIEQTFVNVKCGQIASMVDYENFHTTITRVFSLPFKFHRLENITNNIPINTQFHSVTYVSLRDKNAFRHELFVRLIRVFPFLRRLSLNTILAPNWRAHEFHRRENDWCSIVTFPHLISLDIYSANIFYAEHFLNETKAHLPGLTELSICYEHLEMVTNNFTRDETRRHCAQVKRLNVKQCIVYLKDVYQYFPLLLL